MSQTMKSMLFEEPARPLADQLRPSILSDVVGQSHVLAENAPLGRMLAAGRLSSLILWGPPGCGKTTIARLLSEITGLFFEPVSAVTTGVPELRKLFQAAQERRQQGQGTLLFIDEIHRFNRAQQDVFLPYVEDGTVILVGATTANPSFELNGALLSRCQVFTLNRLDDEALDVLLKRAESSFGRELPLTQEAREAVIAMADGDGRHVLGLAESLLSSTIDGVLDVPGLTSFVQKRRPLYDKAQDGHYNLMSALHKSLRGSDVNAALYWFARMLDGGEDPRYIARRILRFASEDVGLADPQALSLTLAAWQSYERLGSPEGDLCLAEAIVYLACAPKSNAVYMAHKAAAKAAARTGSVSPPKHILNAPTKLMADNGYGHGYAYDHDMPDAFSGQNYFPDGMRRETFYKPVERGYERDMIKRLAYWDDLRRKKNSRAEND